MMKIMYNKKFRVIQKMKLKNKIMIKQNNNLKKKFLILLIQMLYEKNTLI